MKLEIYPSTPTGWKCPVCQHVYAPTTPECSRCPMPEPVGIVTFPSGPSVGDTAHCTCPVNGISGACPVHGVPFSFTNCESKDPRS